MLLKMTTAALSYMYWGRLSDRHGPGMNYRLGLILIAAAHFLWLPVSWLVRVADEPGFAGVIILLVFAAYGASEAAIGIALTQHGFRLTPRERAPTYLAIQPIFYAVVPGMGVFIVGWILAFIHADQSVAWVNPYVVSALLCAVLSTFLIPIAGRLLKRETTG